LIYDDLDFQILNALSATGIHIRTEIKVMLVKNFKKSS